MITAAVQRAFWLTVGLLAALWCGLGVALLVGMGLVEFLAPSSTESSGPSQVLVLTPWLIGLYLLARWALRRSDTLLPAVGDRPTARTGVLWRSEDWLAQHPIWRGGLIVLLELSWVSLLIGAVWAVVAGALLGVTQVALGLRQRVRHRHP